MSVFRINKTADYTVMTNTHLRDKNMSLKAKGLLSVMLSLPEKWDYSIAGLSRILKEGKDAIMSALDELQTLGYMEMKAQRNEKGQFETLYDIYENPNRKNRCGKPESDNPQQLNNNIPITNELNTKNNKKERKAEASYDDIINQSVTNEDTKAALYEFIKMRKLIKKPMTNRALELLIGKLNKLASEKPTLAVEILNQSITNNWQDIYPIKENNNVITQPKTKKANFTERTYSKDDMDKMFSDIHDVDNIDF